MSGQPRQNCEIELEPNSDLVEESEEVDKRVKRSTNTIVTLGCLVIALLITVSGASLSISRAVNSSINNRSQTFACKSSWSRLPESLNTTCSRSFDLTGGILARLCGDKVTPELDIRYFESEKPTIKGIRVNAEQWSRLMNFSGAISEFLI